MCWIRRIRPVNYRVLLSAVPAAGFEAKAANAPQAGLDDEPGHYGEAKALEVTNRIVQYV